MSTINPTMPLTHARNRGVTLVELMVAMVISLIVLYAVGTVYLTSKRTYSVQDEFSRMQESALFAFQHLTQDVSTAGFAGCMPKINNLLNTDTAANASAYDYVGGVYGYEYSGTGFNQTYTIAHPVALAGVGNAGNWKDNNTHDLDAALADKVIPGSDVLIIKTAQEIPSLRLSQNVDVNSTKLQFAAATNRTQGSVFVISDCQGADVFMNDDKASDSTLSRDTTNSCGNEKPCNKLKDLSGKTLQWSHPFDKDFTRIYSSTTRGYYIGLSKTTLQPALFRISYANGVGAISADELVDGVENMQILYGVDTLAKPDDPQNQIAPLRPVKYMAFKDVPNTHSIVSVRISLLMRSMDEISRPAPAVIPSFLLGGVTAATATTVTLDNADSRLRKVFTTTISLRNMLVTGRQDNPDLK